MNIMQFKTHIKKTSLQFCVGILLCLTIFAPLDFSYAQAPAQCLNFFNAAPIININSQSDIQKIFDSNNIEKIRNATPYITNIEVYAEMVPQILKKIDESMRHETDMDYTAVELKDSKKITYAQLRRDAYEKLTLDAEHALKKNRVTREWFLKFCYEASHLLNNNFKKATTLRILSIGDVFKESTRVLKNIALGDSNQIQNPFIEALNESAQHGEVFIPTFAEINEKFFIQNDAKRVHILGMSTELQEADGFSMIPSQFFRHDFIHVLLATNILNQIDRTKRLELWRDLNKKIISKIEQSPNQKNLMDLYFIAIHELPVFKLNAIDYILENKKNIQETIKSLVRRLTDENHMDAKTAQDVSTDFSNIMIDLKRDLQTSNAL